MVAIEKHLGLNDGNVSYSHSKKNKRTKECALANEEHPKSGARDKNASFRLRIHSMGPICKARTKTAVVLPPKEETEDGDFLTGYRNDGLPNDDDCMWLSSGSSSPSSCSEYYKLVNILELSLNSWFVSVVKSPKTTSFSGEVRRIVDCLGPSPKEKVSLVLDKRTSRNYQELIRQESLREEEVISWLVTSMRSCFGQLSLEDSPMNLDSPSRYRASLVDLDTEDSEWISDTLSDMDCFQADFPSPSYKSSSYSEAQSSNSSASSTIDEKSPLSTSSGSGYYSDAVDLEEFSAEKPLFWPSDSTSAWSPVSHRDLFVMSPRKIETSPDLRLKVLSGKIDTEKGCRKRLPFREASKSSKIVELKHKTNSKQVRRVNSMPSRLRKSAKYCMKIVPIDVEDNTEKPAGDSLTGKNSLMLDFESNEELPIETLMGLDEFDGHEGVESAFNKDDFSFDASL